MVNACRAVQLAYCKARQRQMSTQEAVREIMKKVTEAEGVKCSYPRALEIFRKKHRPHEVKMERARSDGEIILAGKREAGDICSFADAIALRKHCWEIQRVLKRNGADNATLREAARIHSKVEAIRNSMSPHSNYSAATRAYLKAAKHSWMH